jgi:glutamyl-Q tRNA(Asp) synthetase
MTDALTCPSCLATAASYIGRFAPSPTGALHLGSLVAAVGSFLDARRHGGRWLVRVEDLDTQRVVPGCAEQILRTLEAFQLHWDGPVVRQSRRLALYEDALRTLSSANLTYECSCSRRDLAGDIETGYPGTCRAAPTRSGVPAALRYRVDDRQIVEFEDRVQGCCRFELQALGDFIVRRKDHTVAYQLAVVVDDAEQRVTDVVRGADLLSSTAWQIALQQTLRSRQPRYAHLPLVVEPAHGKLAKSRGSIAADPAHAGAQMSRALRLLNLIPPAELTGAGPAQLLDWARGVWSVSTVRGIHSISSSGALCE